MCTADAALLQAGFSSGGIIGGAQTFGALAQGKAQSRALKYQKKVALNNAKIARNQADQLEAIGEIDAERLQSQTGQIVGDLEVATGASGVEMSGSAMDIILATREQGLLDADIALFNSRQGAQDLRFQANNLEAQGQLLDFEARNARLSGRINAVGSILNNAERAARFATLGGGG